MSAARAAPWLWCGAALLGGVALAQPAAVIPVERFELTSAVVGRVCRDADGDGRCGADEPGLPGVRVVMETGQAAVTGPGGRYHLAAVEARAPERGAGGALRLLPGRHRVALDPRALSLGETAVPAAATVELPMGGAAIVNFAVRSAAAAEVKPVVPGYAEKAAPSAKVEAGGLRYLVGGQAAPGDEVTVAGVRAEVGPDGRYQAWVALQPGRNRVPITVVSPSGAVRYLTQVLEALKRPGGFLVVPRGLEQVGGLRLPAGRGGTAAAGSTQLRVQGVPGTQVSHGGGSVTVGESGEAQLPLELRPGDNEVRLSVTPPGEARREDRLVLKAVFQPLLVALVDLDGGWSLLRGGPALQGRAAAHAEANLLGWNLAAELDLRDEDVDRVRAGAPAALLLARRPERFERSVDPEQYPLAWGDLSVGLTPNQPQGRLRFEARHDALGTLGYGPHRAVMEDSEVGRFQRVLYGPYLQLEAPLGPVKVGVKAFGQSGAVDPLRPVVTMPTHEELRATSGSVFYLAAGSVVEGSESVRVELRDGLTGLPLSERHLQRGRDYELDWLSGRLLLARPLSFFQGPPALGADALTAGVEPVLVVDAERAVLGVAGRQTVGGGASVTAGPAQVSVGVARELQGTAAYTLIRARGSAQVGPFTVGAEAARSEGEAVAADAFLVSDDGGLSVQAGRGTVDRGDALSVWLRGKGLFDAGRVDAAFRWRGPGFSDRDHRDRWLFRQLSLRVEQPVGDLRVGALADVRASADPRAPFGDQPIASRVLGGSVGYRFGAFEARVEAKDSELTAATDPLRDPLEQGGRTSAGAQLTWKAMPRLSLTAGHVQTLLTRGSGLGALPDTFTSLGAEVSLGGLGTVGAKVGYGPAFGPLAWVHGEHRSGGDWYYGSYSVDVDGPSVGQGRAVSGARSDLGGGAGAFVEEVATHDATAVRMARAVGVSQRVGSALQLEARYERGARHPLGVASSLSRDAAGVSATFIQSWLRLFGRAELRLDRGPAARDPLLVMDLRQHLVSAAAEADLPFGMQLSGRVNWSDTFQAGARAAGFLEGSGALAYRADAWAAILRYSLTREQPLGGAERVSSIASLVPTLRVADRVTVWGGLHAGWSSEAANEGLVLSASVRPAVQVVGGLELSAEVARRSSAPDGGELTALRGEAGWRFGDRTYVGAGYTLLGFTGAGVTPGPENGDRLYVRAELAL